MASSGASIFGNGHATPSSHVDIRHHHVEEHVQERPPHASRAGFTSRSHRLAVHFWWEHHRTPWMLVDRFLALLAPHLPGLNTSISHSPSSMTSPVSPNAHSLKRICRRQGAAAAP